MNSDESGSNLDASRAAVLVLCEPDRIETHGGKTRGAVLEWLRAQQFVAAESTILAPEESELRRALESFRGNADLIVVCGATGLGPRDIAPQTLEALCDFPIPGIGETLRAESLKHSRNAALSRCGGYMWNGALLISIPGNAKAAVEQLDILKDLLRHALDSVKGRCKSRRPVAPNE